MSKQVSRASKSSLIDAAMIAPRTLRRIVMLTPDLSTIGGIQSRTRKVLLAAKGRDVEFVGLSIRNELNADFPDHIIYHALEKDLMAAMENWSPDDTVFVIPNNTIRLLKPDTRVFVERFPLIFNGSGQLSFIMQDSTVLSDLDYVSNFKVTKVVVFSEMDRNVYSQFGLHNLDVGFHPTDVRDVNTYDVKRNKYVTYVGRIDFHTKAADRLVEAAATVRNLDIGPLRIFTTENKKNSPDLDKLQELLQQHDLTDHVEFFFGVNEPEEIYREVLILLLPSQKDSFPNVILEANSFGIPVIAMSYAPGPAETILNDKTGFLVDEFSVDKLTALFSSLNIKTKKRLSANAFAHHKLFSMDRYFDLIEDIAEDAVQEFDGQNQKVVYPMLKPLQHMDKKLQSLQRQNSSLRRTEKMLSKKAEKLEEKLDGLKERLASTKGALERSKAFRQKLEHQLNVQKEKNAAYRASVRGPIVSAFKNNIRSPRGWIRMPVVMFRILFKSNGKKK